MSPDRSVQVAEQVAQDAQSHPDCQFVVLRAGRDVGIENRHRTALRNDYVGPPGVGGVDTDLGQQGIRVAPDFPDHVAKVRQRRRPNDRHGLEG